jgi:type IV fimbrial biogenesis protein FimT
MVVRARTFQQGFTAVEMMVVVGIIAILAAFALPSMRELIQTQKVRTAAYDILSDLTYARSEAIARAHNVQVVSAGGNDWTGGWTITDTTANQMLRTQGALSSGFTFSGDAASLTFDRTGRVTVGGAPATVNLSIYITAGSQITNNQQRCVRISPSGRPNSTTGACT